MTSNLILEKLDDDCLIEIFSHLTIYELIRAERVCRTFWDICDRIYPRFQKMRIELRYLEVAYFMAIFVRVSPYLKSFEFSGGYIMDDHIKRQLILGIHKSPQLQRLSINYTQFSRELMLDLSTCFKNLVFLDLSQCNLDEENMNGIFDDSLTLKNLKTLKIAGNTMLTGNCLKNLIQLEELDASYCYDLRYKEFVRFLRNCQKLLRLDISACLRLVDEGNIIEDLLVFQKYLEKFHFKYAGIQSNDERFAKFEHLKDLEIHGFRYGG